MPHGGYHGTIKIGGNIVQQGDGQGGIQGGIDSVSRLDNQPRVKTNEQIKKEQEKELEKLKNIEDNRSKFLATQTPKALLNQANFLIDQQKRRDDILAGKIVPTKSDFTGFDGGIFGIRTGNFQDRLEPGFAKIREGLSSGDYAKFMRDLYDANPTMMQQMFPVASGQALKPLIAKILEGDLGKLASDVGSGIGSFIDSATGAIFKPRGGTVRPSDVGTPSDTGGVTSVIDTPKLETPSFANVPNQFRGGFIDFYNKYPGPKIGGMMITPVTLPDGSVIEFSDTGTAAIFREYLESIGVKIDPDTGQDIKQVESRPTGISAFDVDKFYASLPQYTQQGIMAPTNLSRFTDALKMFPGATV